jgi:hypothetical protein
MRPASDRSEITAGSEPNCNTGVDVEVVAHLTSGEREEAAVDHPACQQIGVAALELPGARARQREADPAAVSHQQVLHLVEQRRQFLHLVDDDPRLRRQGVDLLGETAGIAGQANELAIVQEVDPVRLGQNGSQPGRLAGAARAEEEERAIRQG